MLGHLLRRWPSIKPELGNCVFSELSAHHAPGRLDPPPPPHTHTQIKRETSSDQRVITPVTAEVTNGPSHDHKTILTTFVLCVNKKRATETD